MKRREFIAGLGVVAARPLAARAQQATMPAVGFISGFTASAAEYLVTSFREGLGEQGYAEGRNVEVLYRWADTRSDRLPDLAADLVKRRVNLIVASDTSAAVVAKSATGTIPIVFFTGSDPVVLGLVPSLNHPGGNVTGVTFLAQELTAKRLELLHEIVPATRSIGYLVNPTGAATAAQMKEAETAARILGLRLVILNASSPDEIDRAFASLVEQRVHAILVDSSFFFMVHATQLAALAARHAIPAIYHVREIVEAGGLISYGGIMNSYRTIGVYTGRILKGEKTADLPVQQSTKVELVINMKAAKALGLEIPVNLLALADEVIE
jgi:putative tryptophan/tyrosine transport system substrate-binding protein